MSKGKRKSLPGAYQIVQQKLRTGTLSEDDRNTLHQLARLDLIDLIENELGLQLKGSHKNSVAAMVEYLLGPEGGQVPGRRKPRKKTPVQLKKVRPVASQQYAGGSSAAAGNAPGQFSCQVQEGGDTTEASYPTGPESAETGADEQQQGLQSEQEGWLRELHMQLKAVQTGIETGDESAGLADDATTPPPPVAVRQALQGQLAGLPGGREQLELKALWGSHNEPCSETALNNEALETKLLDQLLRDMQLSPQTRRQQPEPSPQVTSDPRSSQILPMELQEQQTWNPQHQQQHCMLQQQVPQQQQRQPEFLQPSGAVPAQYTQQLEQEHQEQQNIRHQLQQLLQQAAHEEQQQLRGDVYCQGFEGNLTGSLRQQHLRPCDQQQLPGVLFPPGGVPTAAAAVAGFPAAGYQSCPLPQTTSCAPESWTGTLLTPAEYDTYALSASALPPWQQHQQRTELEGTAAALKKRDRRQMFGQTVGAGVARDCVASEPLSVELSGPSADVTIKRMSFLAPGTGSVSALATSTAGAAAADLQRRFAAAYGHQYLTEASEQQPQQQQQQQEEEGAILKQRTSFKKGVKGWARRFKAFLKSRSSAPSQQQPMHEPLMSLRSAAEPATLGEGSLNLLSELYRPDSAVAVPVGHQHSSNTLADFRLASGTSNLGSFATNRAASAPGAFQLHPLNSQTSQASNENIAEKLQLLRAMDEYQYQGQQPQQVPPPSLPAAAGAVGGSFSNAGGVAADLVPHDMPAVKEEEAELLGTSPAAAAAVAGDVGIKRSTTPNPFMQRLSRAFGLTNKVNDADAAAAAVLSGASGGLSVTERSNSSFSLFLARVASSWRQESSSTAATSLPVFSDKWPSSTTATGRSRLSSFNTSSRQDSRSGVQLSWPSMDVAANPAAATGVVDHSRDSLSHMVFGSFGGGHGGATGVPGVEVSPGSFSRLLGACAGEHLTAGAAPHTVEGSRGSFTRLLGMCAGSAAASGQGGAGHHAVEGSRGSFSQRMLGMCGGGGGGDGGDDDDDAAVGAPSVIEGSKGSFTHRMLGMCAGSDHVSVAGTGHAVEGSRGSFTRMFGLCVGADTAAADGSKAAAAGGAVDGRQGSFSALFGRCVNAHAPSHTCVDTPQAQDMFPADARQHSFTRMLSGHRHTAAAGVAHQVFCAGQQEQGYRVSSSSMDFQRTTQGTLHQCTAAAASLAPGVTVSEMAGDDSPTAMIVSASGVLSTEQIQAAAAGHLCAGATGSGELVEAPLSSAVSLSFIAADMYGAGANI